MWNHRVHIGLVPSSDPTFRVAFERACSVMSLAGIDVDTPEAARIVEEQLQGHGYPHAEIYLFRSVQDYQSHVTNWLVHRNGRRAAVS